MGESLLQTLKKIHLPSVAASYTLEVIQIKRLIVTKALYIR